mgnify:CR=1 FL=1|tara:strand:+ start:70 stop:315 length:246 start_codon:yes stop_codon:yes gene_type:complete
MIDWKKYGPSYTVAPGIKKIGDLPIIEFDDQEDRYLELKKKTKENIFFDPLFNKDTDVEFQSWYEKQKLSMSEDQKAYKLL